MEWFLRYKAIFRSVCKLILLAILFMAFTKAKGQAHASVFLPVAPEVLSNATINCFYKDSHGYMWIGTQDGLYRFDGTRMFLYDHDPDDEFSLPHNAINAITEDDHETVWVGTAHGLVSYRRDLDNFFSIDSIPSNTNQLNNHYITALAFDELGKFWIGTHSGGLSVYDPVTSTYTNLANLGDEQGPGLSIFVSRLLPLGDYVLCATKGGLERFETSTLSVAQLDLVGDPLPTTKISDFERDPAGNIWVATLSGEIFRLIPRNGYFQSELVLDGGSDFGVSWNNILAVRRDAKGNLWIGGENSGLNYFDTRSKSVQRFLASSGDSRALPTNLIRCVYVDDAGMVWIGTYSRGAYLVDNYPRKFENHLTDPDSRVDLSGKDVRCFTEDLRGNVWFAVDGVGLYTVDSNSGKLQLMENLNRQLSEKFITTLLNDRNGNLWIGTTTSGAYRWDSRTNKLDNFKLRSGGIGDDVVFSIYEDKKGTIWMGTLGSGLFFFDERDNKFRLLADENKPNHVLRTAYVSCMTEDSDGVFWVGTLYGLHALHQDGKGGFNYMCYLHTDEPGSLSSSAIQSLLIDKDKNLWVGTMDNGLNMRINGTSDFVSIQKKDGLPTNTIRSLVSDVSGDLWIGTNMGISHLDLPGQSLVSYTREDGLASNNFHFNASLKSSKGELFFGNNSGFNAFYPDSLISETERPVVVFSDFKINNQSVKIGARDSPLSKHISMTQSVVLSYDQRSFGIDFSAINYGHLSRHQYCYKLEGFDTDWNCSDTRPQAAYTNMDPGDYVFLVKAANSSGLWSAEPTRLVITVRPVMWKTWWAYASYALVIFSIIYFLIRIRVERIKMKNQLVMERREREREHELSESKTQFFTNISHELRTPLSLMLMPLESLITGDQAPAAVKEKVKTAYKNADKMMRLVNELMDFNKLESGSLPLNLQYGELMGFVKDVAEAFTDLAERRGIRFEVRTKAEVLYGWFDRDKLEKILVNVLSNAFKFTRDGGAIVVKARERKVSLGEEDVLSNCLELIVVDNGIGISSNEIHRIFDKFYQAKSASKIPNPGTGIGLSLTKGLVELHNGYIQAESRPDAETRFTILIPIDQKGLPAAATRDEGAVVETVSLEVDNDEPLNSLTEGNDKERQEVLVIEDNEELRAYLCEELRTEFTVFEASDGEEGHAIAISKSPDLIISDIMMSGKSGIDLCKAVKADIKTSHIPFILLTAKATIDDQIMGIESGADIYITKPFSVRYLLTHVRHLIETRQKLYAHFSQDVYFLPSKATTNEMDQAFLKRVTEYIVENIQDAQLGVDALAHLFSMSRVQLYRKIKALTGNTAVEFIRRVRLKQALKLMETRQFTLSEIAFQTGFSSASYFTRSFKDEYGKAPSEYLEVGG